MLGGTELIRRKLGKDAYAMTITLLLTPRARRWARPWERRVWLDPNKTSPFEFYQYWRNVGDADVLKCIRMLTFLPLEQIDEMDTWEGSQLNRAKEILAFELTKLVHGEEEAKKAEETAKGLFGGERLRGAYALHRAESGRQVRRRQDRRHESAGGLRPLRLQRRSPPPDSAGRRHRQRQQG
jgi:tyrosyl-tRNA synthetase